MDSIILFLTALSYCKNLKRGDPNGAASFQVFDSFYYLWLYNSIHLKGYCRLCKCPSVNCCTSLQIDSCLS